ncbi:hypothetical protein SCUP234_09292 [Seiridium cupressi]
MKLFSFLVPALAGLAAAADSEVEAYILRSRQASKGPAPSISAPIAQAILQQRLGSGKQLPETTGEEDLHRIAQYGTAPQRLFADASTNEPNQLVVVIKNANADRIEGLKTAISGQDPSFTTPRLDYLPSSYLPTWTKNQCAFEDALNIENKKCWHGKVLYLEYDAVRDTKAVKSLSKNFSKLQSLAASQLETTLVLLPSDSTPSNVGRRDFFEPEAVLNEEPKIQTASASSKSASSSDDDEQSFDPHPFVAKLGSIPACFTSRNACETATSSCSGHGACLNKYKADAASVCFACHCQKTHEGKSKSTWFWGGAACQKQDVSIPFWIFVGFTIFMVGAVGFSISLLFSVGEEKLPGVIGAGVSRGTK